MGKYGFKIRNYEAGSIFGVMKGFRNRYDWNNAMLTNSLFLDFLEKQSDFTSKNDYTKDVIGVEFNYGTHSAKEEEKRLNSLIRKTERSTKLTDKEKEQKIDGLEKLKADIKSKEKKYIKKSAEDIRILFYTKGIDITYGDNEIIHYKMLYRSPGKAKKGTCMFIKDSLYRKARNFLYMGLSLPKENAPIVEIGAYSSLITSTIVGRIQINPQDILILNDVKSEFKTNVVSIEINDKRECLAVQKNDYTVTNEIFDGQALIDLSIFPEEADGYVLLRQHFTKCAAFATDIQLFFKDYFKEDYQTATVKDMFGIEHKVTDIKLITTNNAMKWLKFNVSYETWGKKVNQNGGLWGIVKTAHESKLGSVQRMSYQMVNSLDINIMDSVLELSKDYITKLKTDINVFINYLRQNSNFSNDFDALIGLYEQNHEFEFSSYFRDRRKNIIQTYVLNLKSGKVIQNGDNLTIVGSPYAMLLHSVGEDTDTDPTFETEKGCIQCFTDRFEDGEYLAEFRNPFNSRNNLGYLHNHKHEYFKKYFNFGKLIIAVNMLHTDFQDRNNGSDQDSDSIYVTNQTDIVNHAKECYENYLTIVNNIPRDPNNYNKSLKNYAIIDNTLANAQMDIGESSNLAQICLTYTYNFDDPKYEEYICILSVLAQAAIDGAKRRFNVDISGEIERIKEDMEVDKHGYPEFWKVIRKDFNRDRISENLQCPMNNIYHMELPKHRSPIPTLPMDHFFVQFTNDVIKKSRKVEALIEKYGLELTEYQKKSDTDNTEYLLLREDFEELVEDIHRTIMPKKYLPVFSWLLNRTFIITPNMQAQEQSLKSTLRKRKSLLLKVLYEVNSEAVLMCFSKGTPQEN